MSEKSSEFCIEFSEDDLEQLLEEGQELLEDDIRKPEDIEPYEVDSSTIRAVKRPSINLNASIEEYWEETNFAEYLGDVNDDPSPTTTNDDILLGFEMLGCSASMPMLLFSPVGSLTLLSSTILEYAYRTRRKNKRKKRREERREDIENTYYFEEDIDLSPILDNTKVFVPADTSQDIYMEGVEAGVEVREETDVEGYFEGTTQALWVNRKEGNGFDYQLEVHFDGVKMFRANGYAEMENLDEILEKSDDRSLSSLIFEYTDTSTIKRDNAITKIADYLSKRVSYLPDPT